MAVLNRIECAEVFGNTGVADCSLIPVNILGAFLTPRNFVITEADAENLKEALEEAARLDNPRSRIYPIHGFEAATDNTEEDTVTTLGYGGRRKVRDGKYDWLFSYSIGGICLHNELRKFAKSKWGVLFYDAQGVLYGRNSGGNMAAIPLEYFDAPKWNLNDGATETSFGAQFVFDPKYLNEQISFVKVDFDFQDITGLQTVNLSVVGTPTTTVISVTATAVCGGESLYDVYSAELAAGTLWNVSDAATGASLVIDSVVANDVTKSWVLTLDEARTGPVVVSTKSLSDLETAGIVGFEFKPVTVPAP